jgi:hypothetical protein
MEMGYEVFCWTELACKKDSGALFYENGNECPCFIKGRTLLAG